LEQNESFIAKTCEICGGSDMGYALSELHLICGYGSKNDGEEIRLALCGECANRIKGFTTFLSDLQPNRL